MNICVYHKTEYRYSGLVWLDPHTLRVVPRSNHTQSLLRFELKIDPIPIQNNEYIDAERNTCNSIAFGELTNEFSVTVEFEVETHLSNPFEVEFARPECETIGRLYSDQERLLLSRYLREDNLYDAVLPIASRAFVESNGDTMSFLTVLARILRNDFDVIVRETGAPMSPQQSLSLRRGACRDLAVLYVEACRSQGVAARFVSGYHEGDEEMDRRYLHAWAEVYLPGAGWRGFDPSQGLAVATSHIPVAAGPHSSDASPILGTYRGDGVTSTMDSTIRLEVSSNLG